MAMLMVFHLTFKTRFQSDHVVVLIGNKEESKTGNCRAEKIEKMKTIHEHGGEP